MNAQARAGEPQLILTKSIQGGVTDVKAGDVVRYLVRFECSSLTTSCGQMRITDTLEQGLIYLPPPQSSIPSGFTIDYNSGTRTITIEKTTEFMDGTQFDATIAVRVDNDLRPLPAILGNTVNGEILPPGQTVWQPATPADAPDIHVSGVEPAWDVSKTRVSPSVLPTVDTDVTYEVKICPGTPTVPGNGIAALTDIVLKDTLPPGAVFVSASNSGDYDSGTHTVTWDKTDFPALAGPLYAPDCAAVLVTINYPSAAGFTTSPPGNEITNEASATADYTPTGGGVCVSPCYSEDAPDLTHTITTILDTPTYSKSDYGDPVGWTGTARFILSLDTNATNYPSNNLTMIDELPEHLQVTGITSGAWDDEFDNVRVKVEYLTSSSPLWLPLGTADYNDNSEYDVSAIPNITSVRWVFEYDADPDDLDGNGNVDTRNGLPYMWEFSGSPEVRVTPRRDQYPPLPAAAVLDPAVQGATYNNCIKLTRKTIDGSDPDTNPDDVTDPCKPADMTVQGDTVSLRTSKNEQKGEPWDEENDPNINSFVSDNTLLPGDTLKYTIRVEVTERSSAPLLDPTVLDTLPGDLVYVRDGAVRYIDGAATTVLTKGTDYTFAQAGTNPSAANTLKWEFNYDVNQKPLGSRFLEMDYYARIPRGQADGARTNQLYVTTDSVDVTCETPGSQSTDTGNIDGDGSSAEDACKTTDDYVVDKSAALRGEKWIRSIHADNAKVALSTSAALPEENFTTDTPAGLCPDGGNTGLSASTNHFTRYPCISQAYPEGALPAGQHVPPSDPLLDDFEYNMRVFNDGNVNMIDYVLYDILPYSGDTGSGGTLSSQPRSSEFRPVLTGPIQFLGGSGLNASDFTIEYNLTTKPCRPEVFNEDPGELIPAGCDDTWYEDGVDTVGWTKAQWADVRSYRIRLNSGSEILPYAETFPASVSPNVVRFGALMSIPADSPVVGTFNSDDAQSKEIAWNSFSHVGSYDTGAETRELLASEPRKVGITIPERFSIGNRVWRDSDNSGDINAPDDTDPGIANVLVNLYRASDTSTVIGTTQTDSGGYYLFSNLPAGDYVVGIPDSNFDVAGDPLYGLHSSTGAGAIPAEDYTNPPDLTPDMEDHGIDTNAAPTASTEVFSNTITLAATLEQASETDLSDNPAHGIAGARRGVNGERDYNSDLTVDFGFFGGSDVPFSIGNFVWKDNGAGTGIINNGIFEDGQEPGAADVLVNLYRDGNGNGIPEAAELIRTDNTDLNGFYLFDNLDPGKYYVQVDKTNFQAGGVLAGWYSSHPSGTPAVGTEDTFVFGNDDPINGHTPNTDSDDNGIDKLKPENDGITSGMVELERDDGTGGYDPEPSGETHLSLEVNPADGTEDDFNPTGWDGDSDSVMLGIQGSRGRFGETDETSNLTIDFGFVPPMSLGNRVWIDDGAGEATFRAGYNNGIMDGAELGKAGVTVQLWLDNGVGNVGVFDPTSDTLMYTDITDATGYYLFEHIQSEKNYFVHIPDDNFGNVTDDTVPGNPLLNYISSFDGTVSPPADDDADKDDNGLDNGNIPLTNGVTSPLIAMLYNFESTAETDLGGDVHGTLGQTNINSNLTVDFGFVQPPHSLGNYVWFDTGAGTFANINNGRFNAGEPVAQNVLVKLYLDAGGDGVPDGAAIAYDVTDVGGFYLFDNLPPNRYLVAVDSDNFSDTGALDTYKTLVEYTNSTGTNAITTVNDQRDHGVDLTGDLSASTYGILSNTVDLRIGATIPTGETALSSDSATTLGFDHTKGDGTGHIGRYGETDATSNLVIDFGFYKPMSIGNRVFYDDGGTTGTLNNGVMDGDELPVPDVRVELWRETNSTPGLQITGATPDAYQRYDTTDLVTTPGTGGYYLFDRLAPGDYYVYLPASNFTGAGELVGWANSDDTFADDVDVNDNGVNNKHPETNGIVSDLVTLAWDSEPGSETQLSADTGVVTTNNPTADDGPYSRGRWNESDDNSNLTVDFGFIPPLSLGNRVWIDDGLTAAGLSIPQFNNRIMDGDEVGRGGVLLNLYFDANNNGSYIDTVDGVSEATPYKTYTTDGDGYYLFDGLPQGRYYVQVDKSNFAPGGSLEDYHSSTGVDDDEITDLNDNGQDSATYLADGIRSMEFVLGYGGEPLTTAPIVETDLPNDILAYGPDNWGRYGESDSSSNLTLDFGFVQVRSLGNRVWLDDGAGGGVANDGVQSGLEAGIDNVSVSIYLDHDTDGIPDGAALQTVLTSDGGYYLFENLPPENYLVGVDKDNFSGVLQYMASSIESATPVDADVDKNDHGIDQTVPASTTYGILSPTIDLGSPPSEPTGELDLSGRPADGPDRRGNHDQADDESDLTVDFGFYYPFSIGNRVWRDDGAGGTAVNINNGIMDVSELPIENVRVELYVDDDGTAGLDIANDTRIGHDITDANGYYLFDGLIPGEYYVHIPAASFTSGNPLFGLNSSVPTFADDVDVNDNGVNDDRPDQNGISSNAIILELNNEPESEAQFSGEGNPANGTEDDFNPTGWDGPDSRGRFGEADNNSNLTVDFGFIPVYSLGNRVWLDTGAMPGNANNGTMDSDELGISGFTVNLYTDTDNNDKPDGASIDSMLTDASGYYRFDNLVAGNYIVEVVPTAGFSYGSTIDSNQDADDNVDNNDDGVIVLSTGEVRSKPITLGDAAEPIAEEPNPTNPDSADGEAPDDQSNRTVDFGFVASVAIGNVVWKDIGAGDHYNNGIYDGDEDPIPGVTVELYNATTNTKVITGLDGIPNSGDEGAGGDVTTDADGYYSFDKLIPGDYYVLIPAVEFQAGGHLEDYSSSTDSAPATTDQTEDNDADENGQDQISSVYAANGIRTLTYTLTPGTMPETPDDDETSYTGTLADDSVNFTADFGFTQLVAIGNRVWFDTGTVLNPEFANNSIQDVGEAVVPNVTVQLFSPGTDGVIGGGDDVQIGTDVLTNASGDYFFDNLKPDKYFVHIPAAEFKTGGHLVGYSSSDGQGADETSDEITDENGSDSKPSVNGVSSQLYDLTNNGETEDDDQTSYTGILDDNDVNFTADFGFTRLVAIGNHVWLDTGAGGNYDNGIMDVDENGIPGVTVELYNATTNTKVITGPDGIPNSGDEGAGEVVTDANGYYEFDNLEPGNYYVKIPNTEFIGAEQLAGYTSSTGSGGSQSLDESGDENGQDTYTPRVDGIRSIEYNLAVGIMPTDDDETSYGGDLDDYNVNFTADFGFVEAYSLGNRVWFDQNRNGVRNGAEVGLQDFTVNLYLDNDDNSVPDGSGGVIQTMQTDANGFYRFDNLVAGTYIVEVVPTVGYSSTIDALDPDADADDDDDNGVILLSSAVRSNPVTLGTGGSEPKSENNPAPLNPDAVNGEAPDDRSNRTVDFGFFLSTAVSAKQLTATTMMDTGPVPGTDITVTPRVAIGEILTYTVTFDVPSSVTLANLTAIDTMDMGLGFVGCESISAPNLTTTGSFANACANPTVTPQSVPDQYTDAGQVSFDMGSVTNSTATTQRITMEYRVIVLDIPSNARGVNTLNNSIKWIWDGGSQLPVEADPVEIVEPDLSIDKRATPRRASYGSTIHFTIDIAHTSQSSVDAFDVVVTDVIPAGLTLAPATVSVTGTASTPGNFTSNFDAVTNTLTVEWQVFALAATGRIEFDAVFVGPAPVTNSANVAWTSLPIDPQPSGAPVALSPYTDYGTERWYDPADTANLNTYARNDAIAIFRPVFEPEELPKTGFAPGVWTSLPAMPEDIAYAQTSLALEIPALKLKTEIVGVPFDEKENAWAITWLYRNAGWLENTAFPTHDGNSVLTAHAFLADGTPGPFEKIGSLGSGDRLIVELQGQKYIYEVREVKRVRPFAVNTAFKHEDSSWLTLVTCQSYDDVAKEYRYRIVVRAELVSVE